METERKLQLSLEGPTKRDRGCFYTPDFIAKYMVKETISARINSILNRHLKIKSDSFSIQKLTADKDSMTALLLLEKILPSFTICDLSMGWGVYLLQAFDILFKLYKACFHIINDESGEFRLKKQVKETDQDYYIVLNILQRNIFGADLSMESVKLANLKLVEKAFQYLGGVKLTLPQSNLVLGNSLLGFGLLENIGDTKKSLNSDFDYYVISLFSNKEKEDIQTWIQAFTKKIHWSSVFQSVSQNGGFDIIVGNPPYVNVKRINNTERKIYSKLYSTYNANGDLSNIFWERSINLCKEGGIVSFICPRYWLEGSDSYGLREFLLNTSTIIEIIDFRSNRTLFDQTESKLGVDTAIITVGKRPLKKEIIQVFLMNDSKLVNTIDKTKFQNIQYTHANLSRNKWIFEKTPIISFIEDTARFRLGNDKKYQNSKGICYIGKGCSTGSNKIFRLTKIKGLTFEGANGRRVTLTSKEKDCLRILIKSSDIERFHWKKREQFWIYLKDRDLNQYPNLKSYLNEFRPILDKKQMKYNLLNYYDYAAYRSISLIEKRPNIICPYQSDKNKFAMITEESSSTIYETDVITLAIKDEHLRTFDWFYLLGVLNSELIQYYTKIMNKKVYNLYDYRTNQIASIPLVEIRKPIPFQVLSKSLIDLLSSENNAFTPEKKSLTNEISNILNLLVYEQYFRENVSSDLLDQLDAIFTDRTISTFTTQNRGEWNEILLIPSILDSIQEILDYQHVKEVRENLSFLSK
ncbi:MAG: Eco57I restriction-modification methylase domain-containing protein [Candidatus Heimdallarchaeota archaeon]|nr:Eco57I restriction-modification methylase domain-containing protein [Candidatus Heimdallarchaeota archaeon]